MTDVNDLLPKLPKNSLGLITNFIPGHQKLQELRRTFPYDSKWHTFLDSQDSVNIDGKRIQKSHKERWT